MIIPVREKSILIGALVKMEKIHWTVIHMFAILDFFIFRLCRLCNC